MSNTPQKVKEVIEDNINYALTHGPGLSMAYKMYVLAKDVEGGQVLIGGLGSQGLGRKWSNTEERHRLLPGWDEAPSIKHPD